MYFYFCTFSFWMMIRVNLFSCILILMSSSLNVYSEIDEQSSGAEGTSEEKTEKDATSMFNE
jgi:hypothetical protein